MAENQKEQKQNQLNIEMSPEMAEGVYSNLVMIGHSNSEFIIDFIRILPGVSNAKVKSRIIITPEHAVRLLNTLKDNIGKYEEHFGEINHVPDENRLPLSFGGPVGEA